MVVQVTVVAPNPDVVKKAQIFRNGLVEAWQSKERVGFAMFSRAPVVKGTQYHREAELLGDVAGSDVIIVDEIVDTANTLVRVANVLKVRRRRPGQQTGDSRRAGWGLRREGRAGGLTTHLTTVVLSVVQEKGAKNIYVFAAHGIFTSDALFKIESTPHLTSVVVTNTIPLPPHYSGHKVSQHQQSDRQPALDLPCPGLTWRSRMVVRCGGWLCGGVGLSGGSAVGGPAAGQADRGLALPAAPVQRGGAHGRPGEHVIITWWERY